jgi:hypothetical protein
MGKISLIPHSGIIYWKMNNFSQLHSLPYVHAHMTTALEVPPSILYLEVAYGNKDNVGGM